MKKLHLALLATLVMLFLPVFEAIAECSDCCGGPSSIQYCDSSVGRYVCNNGEYSACYCERHAIMDLQKLEGCCLWQGGVFKVNEHGVVICNNGSLSELCTLQNPIKRVAI